MNNLKENLNTVRTRLATACKNAGRNPADVRLLAVSKKHSVDKIRQMHALGHAEFGENRIQEGLQKIELLADLELEWHFIGPLQSNKTREAAEHFDWVQSVDREKTLRRLSTQRPPLLPPLNILLQVNIDREPQKAGLPPEQLPELATLAADLPAIRLRGLMCIPEIASTSHDPADSYQRMAALFGKLQAQGFVLDTLSMGMSGDLESAIMHGSTMVRVGTDLFGKRPV